MHQTNPEPTEKKYEQLVHASCILDKRTNDPDTTNTLKTLKYTNFLFYKKETEHAVLIKVESLNHSASSTPAEQNLHTYHPLSLLF